MVLLLRSHCSPIGLGCPSFEHYPRKFGILIAATYLITNNTKKDHKAQ
jgi:hypothetical protein